MMRGLDDLVRQGKVHYVGASNFPGLVARQGKHAGRIPRLEPAGGHAGGVRITERSCEPEFLPLAHEMDVALVVLVAARRRHVHRQVQPSRWPKEQLQRLVDEIEPAKRHYWHEMTERNLGIMDGVVAIADRHRPHACAGIAPLADAAEGGVRADFLGPHARADAGRPRCHRFHAHATTTCRH